MSHRKRRIRRNNKQRPEKQQRSARQPPPAIADVNERGHVAGRAGDEVRHEGNVSPTPAAPTPPPKQQPTRPIERINVVVLALTLGVLAVYTCEVSKQTGLLTKTFDLTDKQFKRADATFKVEQRPYVVTTTPVYRQKPEPGIPIKANIAYKNIGKTPATRLALHFSLEPLRSDMLPADYRRFVDGRFCRFSA